MLQALPSIVAAQTLNPEPGSRVLDMCAAPGGKASMLAQMMGDVGTVVALDRTQMKVQQIQSLAADWGLTCVQAFAADATQLFQQTEQQHKHQRQHTPEQMCTGVPQRRQSALQDCDSNSGQQLRRPESAASAHDGAESSKNSGSNSDYRSTGSSSGSNSSSSTRRSRRRQIEAAAAGSSLAPEVLAAVQASSFDAVLLDAPCSALGLRPKLLVDWTLPALQKLAAYQRALLHSAVHVLRPGGHLVYCTCTINPGGTAALH